MIFSSNKFHTKPRIIYIGLIIYVVGLMNTVAAQPVLPLNDAIGQALTRNFNVQIAKNDAEIAAIENNWGNAGRLPTVNATGAYNYSNTSLDQKLSNGTNTKRSGVAQQTENAAVTARWNVFNGFRVVAAKERLEIQEDIGNLQIKQMANETVYNVVSTYINLMRLKQEKLALQETMQLFEERMKLAENRFKIGVAGKSDFLQAQVDYNQQMNTLLQNEINTKTTQAQLNNLLVRNPDELFTVEDTLTQVTLPGRSGILATVDSLNPQVLIAKAQELVLIQQYREINALRLPTLALNAGASLNNSASSAGFTLRNFTYGPTAGISLAVPIYQAGIVKQQLRVNKVQQKTQRLLLESIRNDLGTMLANAYNTYENSQRKYNLEKENLVLVKENNMIAMERFRKGSITTVELRQTQINFIESQTRMINALYEMKQAEADVLLVMGRLVQ